MVIESNTDPSVAVFERALAKVAATPGVQSLLIWACDENGYLSADLDPILRRQTLSVLGGVFPRIMVGLDCMTTGFAIVGLKVPAVVKTVSGLSDPTKDFEAELESVEVDLAATKTLFVFVDGLASRISALVEDLFAVYGLEANYIGGGAGSLSFEQRPCLFTNAGLVGDCAVVGFVDLESGIGVSHGWSALEGPFEVTNSKDNAIVSLDWRPAREVYQEAVEARVGAVFSEKEFFEVSREYPFGISKLGAEKIVRDPIALREDGSIVCIGDVPNQAFVHIMSGDPETLVRAACEAARLAREAFRGDEEKVGMILIDCISRQLFLGDAFSKELAAVAPPDSVPLVGALTLGEIANNRKDYLEFYNKTAVVGVMEI